MIGNAVLAHCKQERGVPAVDLEARNLAANAEAMIVSAVASDVWPTVKQGPSRSRSTKAVESRVSVPVLLPL